MDVLRRRPWLVEFLHGRIPRGVGVASNDRNSHVREKRLHDLVLLCHVDTLDKFEPPSGVTSTHSRRPGKTILYRDHLHRARSSTPPAELDWTGLTASDSIAW